MKQPPRERVNSCKSGTRVAGFICIALGWSFFINACGTGGPGSTVASSGFTENAGQSVAEAKPLPVINTDLQAAAPGDSTENSTELESATCGSSEQVKQEHLLILVNTARSQGRTCGGDIFPAAGPLTWNEKLGLAAHNHSNDMATHNYFSHSGSDGSSVADRISKTGYQWRTVGENIAAGRESAADTVSDWLGSVGHCRNLMNPDFTEMAVACVHSAESDYLRYWTNTLASKL